MFDTKNNKGITVAQIASTYISVLDNYHGPLSYKIAALVFLHTLVNPDELTSLHWNQVNKGKSEITLLYGECPRVIPISSNVVALLNELSELHGEDGFVFPSLGTSKPHLSYAQLDQIFKTSGNAIFLRLVENIGLATFIRNSMDWKPALVHFGAISGMETLLRGAYIEEQRDFVEAWSVRLMRLVDTLRDCA